MLSSGCWIQCHFVDPADAQIGTDFNRTQKYRSESAAAQSAYQRQW